MQFIMLHRNAIFILFTNKLKLDHSETPHSFDTVLCGYQNMFLVFISPYIFSELNQNGYKTIKSKCKSTILDTECQSKQLKSHDKMKTSHWL